MIPKFGFAFSFLAAVSLSLQAGAGSATGAAAATIIVFGLGVGATGGVYEGVMRQELPDWKRTATDSTAKLESQCGLTSEFHLVGNNRLNGVFVSFHNQSETTWVIKPTEITVAFGSGRERSAEYFVDVNDEELKPNWRMMGFVPLPQKSDFKDQDVLSVLIPIYKAETTSGKPDCVISARMEREKEVPHIDRTSTSVTTLEFYLGFGLSLFRTNDLPALGWKQAPTFDLGAFVYPGIGDGFGMGIAFNDFGGGDPNVLSPATGGLSSSVNLVSDFYYIAYSHRFFLSESNLITVDLGIGDGEYVYGSTTSNRNYADNFAFIGRISYDHRFSRVYSGFWIGDYFWGVTLYDNYIPVGNVGPVEATGHSIGTMARIKIGI